ncbi:uncharacterized protein LOC106519492 [Austrofundulus limnaeus]|uniref:Uncharacterized protein LOC106519492 n=1 Tax=Austrofundulus limnaeus TaxID=52670 RepID=A0A2I4BFY5_AUSLI|nr:PREDICTED: uncharacterized protein LOC106519492 [Austrofundulus limnaeus]
MADNTRQRKPKDADGDLVTELRALSAKFDRMQTSVEEQMNAKIDSLRGSLERTISESQAALKSEWEKTATELRLNLDMEVGILVSRMEKIELKMAENETRGKSFDPDVSLIVAGLPQADGDEDVVTKVKDLLREGLRCEPVPEVVAAERVRARGQHPGLVKVELKSVQDKVMVLRRKSKLRDHANYERVFVSSAKSHAERLLDYNLRTLLREIPAGKHYYLAANGRLVKRPPTGEATGNRPPV